MTLFNSKVEHIVAGNSLEEIAGRRGSQQSVTVVVAHLLSTTDLSASASRPVSSDAADR